MNYQNPEKQTKRNKVLKSLTAFVTLILGCFIIFSAPNTSSQALPDCAGISGTAQPGSNCSFYGMLLCQTVPSAGYSISSSRILSSGQNHRVNCADLSDLPLCDQIDSPNTQNIGKNCVKQCNDASFNDPNPSAIPANVRGIDYAVHNRDCVRFCDAAESGITANPGVNCVARKCQQLASGVAPNPNVNCNLLPCNLLTPDELNDVKFGDDTKQYCDGSNVKCYSFLQSQLPYTIVRGNNTMCKIHDCKPASATCGADDTLNISNQGTAYTNTYIQYINAGFALDTTTMCTPVTCKPVVNRQYRCSPQSDPNPTTANSSCDSSGPGASCGGGYCYRTIDCNLSANSAEPECIGSTSPGTPPSSSNTDPVNSWFYRPSPMSKATTGGMLLPMDPALCYHRDQMENNGWGHDVTIDLGLLGTIDLGYFHDYLGMDTRSPGMCNMTEDGSRGNGYIYLCGTSGLLYNKASQDTAYHQGYVQTTFYEGDADNKVTVCLRFNNAMIPQKSCGARECGITCAFDLCSNEVCGRDVCRDLTVKDTATTDCMMSDDLFSNDPDKGCMADVDGYMRLRAVKYKNRICTYLDVKGQLAYSPMFLDGSETLSDGTCFSGIAASDGSCSGSKNTNDDNSLASKWRTLFRIPYITNNQPAGSPAGYLDINGQLFREQECMNAPLRISPPRIYNLGNLTNSSKLFTPPIYIADARVKRGGNIAVATGNQIVGKTDFHYPEIEVRFGGTLQKLSLGLGYTGYETSGADPLGSSTISTTVATLTYSIEVFVRKEFDGISATPLLCLYRKVQDSNGAYLDPFRIQCVERELPEIDNSAARALNPLLDPRKVVVYPDPTNTYNSSKIVLRYLGDFGPNNVDDNCGGDDICTAEVKLDNINIDVPTCSSTVETDKLCAQREECSRLNVECIQNEINLQNAKAANQPIDSFMSIRRNCNQIFLPLCNIKKGIITDPSATAINPNPTGATADPNAYGWFNEICISSGFETKLKTVIANDMNNSGAMGKCVINALSPYLTDGDSSTNCDAGGKAPNCLCLEVVPGVVDAGAGQVERQQTAHEAGLCVDMPLPETCAPVDYNTNPNPDTSDPEYVAFSLNNNTYGTVAGTVHISHSYRTSGKPAPNPILLLGHAEFPLGVMGMNDIEGECKGFWKNAISSSGVSLLPLDNCLNVAGHAQWDSAVRNQCIRYSCPEILTTGPDSSGIYQGNYGALESGENKGSSDGFAMWTSYLKTNDFLETVTANSCITGFKKAGATTLFSAAGSGEGNIGNANTNASLYNRITGYSGGTAPTRTCNQVGQWNSSTNPCQRIACPADSPPIPSGSGDSNAWALWANSGGASFPSVNASRSSVRVQQESISTGTCNNSLGFFQPPGGNPPTRKCDQFGNWLTVDNACVSQCTAITLDSLARNVNNGFAFWPLAANVPIGGQQNVAYNGCVSGYVTYPYPPLRDNSGNAFTISASGPYRTDSGANSTLTTIPLNVASDTRAPTAPQRVCKSVTVVGGSANVWTAPSSSCINTCPGYDTDPRIGVGVTQHPTSTGTINANWPATALGTYQYVGNPANFSMSASDFTQGRNNQRYLLRRFCNSNGAWSAPETLCVATGGQVGNATYNINSLPAGKDNSYPAGSSLTVSGNCVSGYWNHNRNNDPAPQVQCVFEDSHNYIDKVYWQLVSGYNDCEQVTCAPFSDSNINGDNRGSITVSSYRPVGTQVNASCNFTGSVDTWVYGGFDNFYFTTSVYGDYSNLLVGSAPYTTCQNDGNWSAVTNLGNCKKPCLVPSFADTADASGCRGGTDFHVGAYSLQHGQIVHFTINDTCDNCQTVMYAGNCNDGTYSSHPGGDSNEVSTGDSDYCSDFDYDAATNQITRTFSVGALGSGYSTVNGINTINSSFTIINGNNQLQTIGISY